MTDPNQPTSLDEAQATARSALWSLGLFSLVINLLMLAGPLFMLQVYDRVLPSGSVPTLVVLIGLVIVLYLFLALLEMVRGRVLVRLGRRFDEILHKDIFRAVFAFTAREVKGAGSQPLRDLDMVRGYIAGPGPLAFFDVPWVPIYIGLVFMFHPLLGIFAVVAAAVLAFLAILNKRLTHETQIKATMASESAHRFAEEGRRQAGIIKSLGMGTALLRLWEERKEAALKSLSDNGDRAGLVSSTSKAARLLFQSGILAVGAWLAIRQSITPGIMIAASIIMSRALAPLEQMIVHWRGFTTAQRSWARIRKLLAEAPPDKRRTALPRPSGQLSVSNLVCLMPDKPKPIVAGATFELQPGDGLGIIGPSGAGKSTLAKALLGIWPNTRGEVRLDGATHDQWDGDALGRHLGYLPQEIALLPGTLAQNISRFDPQATPQRVIEAAELAGVHRLALTLENGYDTVVGLDGTQLSAGQIQRVALARAVYGNPALVVLDEPNSNLDSEGDDALMKAITALRAQGTTVVVVAHRASAINALDTLLYIREGRPVFYGPKDGVLRQITQAVAQSTDRAGRGPAPNRQIGRIGAAGQATTPQPVRQAGSGS